MPKYVAFLRAINVGGHGVVTMETLRKSFVRLGFTDVETFIASGNVLFSARVRDTAKLERQIEARLSVDLGHEVSTFVRRTEDVIAIARYQPFSAKVTQAAVALNVGFLATPLPAEARKALDGLATPIDLFHVTEREWYWLSQAKQSDSKVSNAAIERALKMRSTLRGMKTIVKLAAKLEAAPARAGKRSG